MLRCKEYGGELFGNHKKFYSLNSSLSLGGTLFSFDILDFDDVAHHVDASDIVSDPDGGLNPHSIVFEGVRKVERFVGIAVVPVNGKESAFQVFLYNSTLQYEGIRSG